MRPIEEAMSGPTNYRWIVFLQDFLDLSENQSEENKILLQKIIEFKGKLQYNDSYMNDGPHSRTPEDMIKNVAEQILSSYQC